MVLVMAAERVSYEDIDPYTYSGIRSVLAVAFADDDGDDGGLEDFSDFDHWFIVRREGRVVAVTGLLHRTVIVNGSTPVEVAALGGVATVLEHQNRGLATHLVSEAVGFGFAEYRTRFVLLQCLPNLVPFYESRGWRPLDVRLLCRQADGGTYPSPEVPMVFEEVPGTWPLGPIDMNGLPW